jgi:hypothetical protein
VDRRDEPLDAAELAFESLRAEVIVMRRALETLVDRLEEADRGGKIDLIGKGVVDALNRLDALTQAGAVANPADYRRDLASAREAALRPAQDALQHASRELAMAAQRLDAANGLLRRERERGALLRRVAGIAALIGFMAFPLVAFPLARALPDGWRLPERLAAMAIGER